MWGNVPGGYRQTINDNLVLIVMIETLEPLDSFGRNGIAPGEFYVMHHMNVDSKGNLYVTEVQDGKRIQKFVFKGYTTAPAK